jgi:hypothetical protein
MKVAFEPQLPIYLFNPATIGYTPASYMRVRPALARITPVDDFPVWVALVHISK